MGAFKLGFWRSWGEVSWFGAKNSDVDEHTFKIADECRIMINSHGPKCSTLVCIRTIDDRHLHKLPSSKLDGPIFLDKVAINNKAPSHGEGSVQGHVELRERNTAEAL